MTPRGKANVSDTGGFILTKIIATMGPAASDPQVVTRLVEQGVRVLRINFSHGGTDQFQRFLDTARQVSRELDTPIAVMGDLAGPKIRTGRMSDNGVEVQTGDLLEVTPRDVPGGRKQVGDNTAVVVPANYPDIVDEVHPGERLLIDDGSIRTLVLEKDAGHDDGPRLVCRITVGGTIGSRKGINLPDSDIRAPSLTDWDQKCLQWAVEHELDYLALSFVRSAADVQVLRDRLKAQGKRGGATPIIAKIEKPQALNDLDAICNASEAIMVARGDLGVEMDVAEVPVIQKRIILKAHEHGKPAIVATQMLQSMIDSPTPTRAEVSDVANAIIDQADAVMLSGETAIGRYPQQAVHMIARIAKVTEAYAAPRWGAAALPPARLQETRYRTAALAHGVSVIVEDLAARFVVTWSELGGGARYLSQNRLNVPIIAISSNPAALRRMALLFGVTPVPMDRPSGTAEFLHNVDRLFDRMRWAEPGEPIVIVKGEPLGTPGVTNMIRIHYVGDVCRLTWHAKPNSD